ncbi:MAG TPA: pyridoxal-dependent decarboxylase, partial [Candidatus Eisenbacteria bacterium]
MTHDPELDLLGEALALLRRGFTHLPPVDGVDPADLAPFRSALLAAAERMQDNFPYHHPLYVGQMLKPPHPVARLAYAMAMHVNPNNHALDGGRASSAMEKEAVAAIARMFGWSSALGHLAGGGTMANFEALWVAREMSRETHGDRAGAVAASSQAHYTHSRLSAVLDMPLVAIDVDEAGRMDMSALEAALDRGERGEGPRIDTVVAALGTTAIGSVDPLASILAMRERRHKAHGRTLRVHVDTAYGGY